VKEEAPENTSRSTVTNMAWLKDARWQAYFGTDVQDMDTKLKVYKALVEELNGEDIQPVSDQRGASPRTFLSSGAIDSMDEPIIVGIDVGTT
jgi:hypothetical protein